MKLLTQVPFLFAAVFAGTAVAAPPVAPVEAMCKNKNNLERCFSATPALAIPYCSSFLSVPAVTEISTTTPYAYVTVPQTVSTETDVLTSSTVSTSISVSTLTTTATIFSTTTIAYIPIQEVAPTPKAKRDPKHPKPSPTVLACLKDVKAKSFFASVSTACHCLAVTPLTISLTSTADTSTVTAFSPVTVTTFTTTIVQIVTVIPSTLIETAYETDVLTSTAPPPTSSSASSTTSSSAPVKPTCIPNSVVGVDGNNFSKFFSGSGVREPLNNPATEGVPPDVTTFPGTLTDCEAVSACIRFGYFSANNDYTFDIHYLITEDVWSCAGFYQGDSTSYFTITDSNVGVAYGFNAIG